MNAPGLLTQELPLYPTEDQIGQAVLGSRHKHWPAMAAVLERQGLPRINPERGGRFWPAVVAYFMADEGLDGAGLPDPTMKRRSGVRIAPFAPDGSEDFNAEKTRPLPHQRRARGTRRAGA